MQIYTQRSGAQSVVVNAQFMALFRAGSPILWGFCWGSQGKRKMWPKVCPSQLKC